MEYLKNQLEKKKSEIINLEARLTHQTNTSQYQVTESQFTSKKSVQLIKTIEDQTQIFLKNINELELKITRLKTQNRSLFKNLIDSKQQHQQELTLLYSVFVPAQGR